MKHNMKNTMDDSTGKNNVNFSRNNKPRRRHSLLKKSLVFLVPVIVLTAIVAVKNPATVRSLIHPDTETDDSSTHTPDSLPEHDLVLEDNVTTLTAADYADVILKKGYEEEKLQVYYQNMNQIMTISVDNKAPFFGRFLSKSQEITFKGIATYTVDLSKLDISSVAFDEEHNVITVSIPHAELDSLNIPDDQIKYGDVKKGSFLVDNEITVSTDTMSKTQIEAQKRMEEKLASERVSEKADKSAKKAIEDIYTPVIQTLDPDCTLEVEII